MIWIKSSITTALFPGKVDDDSLLRDGTLPRKLLRIVKQPSALCILVINYVYSSEMSQISTIYIYPL